MIEKYDLKCKKEIGLFRQFEIITGDRKLTNSEN
jgi:hypothetical protein